MNVLKINSKHTQEYIKKYLIQLTSSGGLIVLTFLFNLITTAFLSPEEYGRFRFVYNFMILVPVIANLGFTYSLGRIIANTKERKQNSIIGTGLIIGLSISIITSFILMVIFLLLGKGSYNISSLLIATPFIFITILQSFILEILQGQNNIYQLSLLNVLPQAILFIILIILALLKKLSFNTLFAAYIAVNFIITIYRIKVCKPDFSDLRDNFKIICLENQKNGFKVFSGSIFGIAITQIISLVVGGYIGMEEYAYFSFALSLATPFTILTSSLGVVMYRSNVDRNKISNTLLFIVFVGNLLIWGIFIIIVDYIFQILFPSYLPALFMTKILSLYGVIKGFGDFINKFIGAKGYGSWQRNSSMLTGLTSLVIATLFVPIYQETGLVISYFLSGIVYFLCVFSYYFKYCKSISGMNHL